MDTHLIWMREFMNITPTKAPISKGKGRGNCAVIWSAWNYTGENCW